MNGLTRGVMATALLLLVSGCLEDTALLKVGMPSPSLPTKTLADVGGDLSRVTTYRYPDERMYSVSLDVALQSGKPLVLEFATPAHCTVCDKQLQMLKALNDKYGDKVVFLHFDQYQNPQAFRAFKVIGDPWTIVIDSKNIVRYREPGRMLYGELDGLINEVLAPPQAERAVGSAG